VVWLPAQQGCGYQSPGHGALLRVHTEAYSHRPYPPPPASPSLTWPSNSKKNDLIRKLIR
jgi:hypothetical protein